MLTKNALAPGEFSFRFNAQCEGKSDVWMLFLCLVCLCCHKIQTVALQTM